jgi:GxxExxY protein
MYLFATYSYFILMIDNNYPQSELISRIIGCAIEVHNELGNGFQEKIYHRALAHEFDIKNVKYSREHEMTVCYIGVVVGIRRVDFLVEKCIAFELKAVIILDDIHLAQAINYLETYHLQVGLLLNFSSTKLDFKRLHNKKF